MTGIDASTVSSVRGRPQPLDGHLSDVLSPFNAEFFVDWQVAEHPALVGPGSRPEK